MQRYDLLGLATYFTAGVQEVRAWTFKQGMKAPQCAGVIHTDFERGFIRAETVSYDDLMTNGSMTAAKEAGKVRLEGKEYIVKTEMLCTSVLTFNLIFPRKNKDMNLANILYVCQVFMYW